ncbi:MAG: phosphotransferase [Acidobacteriota bacterium]|nr:phosphotransferase [Acidobacteriota bacterium]
MDMPNPHAVTGEILAWLEGHGFPGQVQPLPGDVSPRRYFHVQGEVGPGSATAILAVYPPEVRSSCQRFLRSGELLTGVGVRVPEVLAVDCGRGWMLIEDLGPRTLADCAALPWNELATCFLDAIELGRRIAGLPERLLCDLNPPLDRALLHRELTQTWELFLEPRGLTGEVGLAEVLEELCANLAAESPVPCHRDFMARNLMPLTGGRVAVLDHQDLRLGPPAYDLASLLNDTLFPPPGIEERLLDAALASGIDRVGYHRAAAQRTLKAVGTYTAFSRRGSDRHLHLVWPTLKRSLVHLARVPESAPLVPALERLWSSVEGMVLP